jgi:hypothetical protein
MPFGFRRLSWSLILMIATLVAAFVIAIVPFHDVPDGGAPPPGYGAYGYTWSLALTGFPLLMLLRWLVLNKPHACQIKAFLATGAVVFAVWSVLDILAAHELFCFPNEEATSGINLFGYKSAGNTCSPHLAQGWGWNVPIEEFLFYLFAVLVVVLLYMWSSEEWFGEYSKSEHDYRGRSEAVKRAIQPHGWLIAGGLLLFVLCVVYKKTVPDPELRPGIPWYAAFLILVVLVPHGLLYRAVGRLVNERALLFTMTVAVLVSLLWEVTLARPNLWWDYQYEKTIGMRIYPWNNLPVEAAVLWIAAGWGDITLYELFRVYFHSARTLPHLMTGRERLRRAA